LYICKKVCTDVLQNDKSCIDQLNKYKRSLSLETGLSAEIANIVKLFIEALNENVFKQRQLAEMSLAQKERTITDFTISLIGRTKAGKSTLHAILTNQGYDKIGMGKQRTTKYNRVYQWNLLRLIDTPGIGSAEAAGRTDDEIAESVLGESDVICFVVVDDSILKDILEFIEKVAALNKPVIILLNHKENIMSDVKFKRFVEKPSDWLAIKGESNLQGHINRIQKYADDHGFGTQ
jgi:GTPase